VDSDQAETNNNDFFMHINGVLKNRLRISTIGAWKGHRIVATGYRFGGTGRDLSQRVQFRFFVLTGRDPSTQFHRNNKFCHEHMM
jgi:hypothetical protein